MRWLILAILALALLSCTPRNIKYHADFRYHDNSMSWDLPRYERIGSGTGWEMRVGSEIMFEFK